MRCLARIPPPGGKKVSGAEATKLLPSKYREIDNCIDLRRAVKVGPVLAYIDGSSLINTYSNRFRYQRPKNGLNHAVIVLGYSRRKWKITSGYAENWKGHVAYLDAGRDGNTLGIC